MGSIPTRGSPAIALPLATSEFHFARRRTSSRPNSSSSTDSTSANFSQKAMAIPGIRRDTAPPPLPPPRHNHDLANGNDLAWRFENADMDKVNRPSIVKEGSSLLGGFPKPRQQSVYRRSMELDRTEGHDRRGSAATITPSVSTVVSRSGTTQPNTVGRAPSPTTNAMLHGERPLAQENINRSNQAYDQAVLSKIGKSNSPPRHLRGDSGDSPVLAQKLSLQTKDMKAFQPPTINELSATTADSTGRWPTSPASTGASPFSRPNWRDYNTNPRSPGNDTGAHSGALDPELFVYRSAHYRSTTSSNTGVEDLNSRSGRSSYDQNMNTPASDSLESHLDDHKSDQGACRQGMKRKSPPSEEDRQRPDLHPRLATRIASHSPSSNHTTQQGSVASTPSSAQQSSYNSSGAFSVARGSMTSMSSFDAQSPKDSLHPAAYITSAPLTSSPVTLIAPRKPHDSLLASKMSIQLVTDLRPAARIGNHYICACCPKKPKKFDTEDQLRTHENEKQYSCHFCHNRFKNKNEAERHQNSLHLRKHSWSCSALNNYQAAFSPSGAVDSESAATDACGYCGEEFPNQPFMDWDRRIEHLTNVHKFGECNSSKKFFRADHFRQHLKHSHAGKSGKWTNILEHACVRDEILPEVATYQLSTGEVVTAPVRGSNLVPVQLDHSISASAMRLPEDKIP